MTTSHAWPERFPPFLWGVATSSHQIEGHTLNDWTAWADAGHVARHERADLATDHWHRWEDDFALFARMGINSYRFSLEWSRIEPEPGTWNLPALAQYRRMIGRMRELGWEPLLTLHHFTLPPWLAHAGGILAPSAVPAFSAYVERAMAAVGDLVDLFITINEPTVYAVQGYLRGAWPPGQESAGRTVRVIRRMLKLHRAAYGAIKAARPNAAVGLAHHYLDFAPLGPRPAARVLAWLSRYLFDEYMIARVGTLQDFIGVNYYTRQWTSWRHPLNPTPVGPGVALTDSGWAICPEGLEQVLVRLARFQRPLVITENGMATEDDGSRSRFLRDHLAAVSRARAQGADVRGYFYWSALDNFEWAEGFGPRFGLAAVDYATFHRELRDSAALYARTIAAHPRGV